MAKKIIGMLQPFDIKQMIYVYEDGNKIDIVEANVDNFQEKINELINKYNITDISLSGPKQYTKKLGEDIEKQNLSNYLQNPLDIKYI